MKFKEVNGKRRARHLELSKGFKSERKFLDVNHSSIWPQHLPRDLARSNSNTDPNAICERSRLLRFKWKQFKWSSSFRGNNKSRPPLGNAEHFDSRPRKWDVRRRKKAKKRELIRSVGEARDIGSIAAASSHDWKLCTDRKLNGAEIVLLGNVGGGGGAHRRMPFLGRDLLGSLLDGGGMNAYGGRTTRTGAAKIQTQVDASTQADLVGYESEDERLGRRGRSKRGTPYSKIDIREQYCINNKEVQVLESGSSALFGCLSKHNESSCSSRHSFLSVCMGRVPSDENLHDIRRQPLPRRPVDDLERAYLRRRPKSLCGADPGRYTWIPEDEGPLKLEHQRPLQSDLEMIGMRKGHTMSFSSEHLASSCPAHYLPPPPPPPSGASRAKHVSFARSHTLTSFDDAMIELRKTPQLYKSQERLILSTQPPKKALHTTQELKVVKKTPMKTQATQTGCLGREPPTYLSLSPRTVHRVKMVSQGAQTNGQLWNGRRLMKSYSEAGYHFGDGQLVEKNKEHDALTRTQSEEPRSPYMKQQIVLPWPAVDKASLSSLSKLEERRKTRSSRVYKEIFIDFEPVENEKRSRQSFVDGEFLSEQSMEMDVEDQIVDRVDGVKVSLASFSTASEDEIQTEGTTNQTLLFPHTQDSVDEEFHENLVYGGIFNKYGASEQNGKEEEKRSGTSTPETRDLMPMATLNISRRASPFASSDSLANDQKDHSDGIWNESQSTVLQAEFENGDGSTRTPSKKQLLLLQHQQRSSMDTEVLESDVLHSQSPVYSPLNQESAVPFVTVAAVHKNDSPPSAAPGSVQSERKPTTLLGPNVFYTGIRDSQRKLSKSPEKEEIRLDSGRATDISETSTTDDYATAHDNSGTDTNSKRSGHRPQEFKPGSKEGSSFESASSAHSFAREDTIQVVPSSPSTIAEENAGEDGEGEGVTRGKPVEIKPLSESQPEEKEEMSGDAESSSSGSYSLDNGQREHKPDWTDQDRRRMKKEFKLDLSDRSNEAENWSDGKDIGEKTEDISPRLQLQKMKYSTVPTRKSQQASNKKWNTKGNGDITPKMVRSPAMPEGFLKEDWTAIPRSASSHTPEELHVPKNETEISSDESSCDLKITGIDDTINGYSPRRQRRRGGGRGRRNQTSTEHPARRRPLTSVLPNNQEQLNPPSTKYNRSPAHSPRGSPRKAKPTKEGKKNTENPEGGGHLKTLSAESLRSVSPGSDSVFYNEGETHLLCHQCGREFEGEPVHMEMEETVEEIVQPPAGFADSPENTRNKSHRLYKKQEKRFRSEERGGERRRHSRFRAENLRAKSEERGKEKGSKNKLRPHARSTDASMELLRCADSSPSISEPLTSEEPKIYSESFKKASWICIVEGEVSPGWNRSLDTDDEREGEEGTRDVTDSTSSEKEFKRKYQAATHRMVHRKSSMEMYRRLQSKSFGFGIESEGSLRRRLEDVLQMMLVVWSTQEKALRVVKDECDKKVVVSRKSGEFGFRIHGSRPVVVSAIEPDTPAESSGLEVGDIVLSVNGVSVLEASHSDVVKLAHAGSDTLELEVARTSYALTPVAKDEEFVQISGFLSKRGMNDRWHQRWFALKNDNCLYYFKSQVENQPLGALMLYNYKFKFTPDSGKAYSFILQKEGAKSLELAAETEETAYKWKAYLEKAMEMDPPGESQWFEKSCRFLQQPASTIPQPDCFGHLTQLEDKWRRRYCVLKDAALLLYADSSAPRALAVACLQGYRVQSSGVSGKRFSFEVVPPESKQKHFYFYTDTEMDKKRWIAAIEYSIDRWMRVG